MDDFLKQLAGSGDQSGAIPFEIFLLIGVVGIVIVLWDLFDRHSSRIRQDTGLDSSSQVIAIKGSSYLPSKEYISRSSGLASTPHAALREGEYIIPVDVNPMSKKVKDRHVVQLLLHMRLIEEIEGVRPPHGLLLMGPEARTVKIKNSDEKQRWLQTLIDEMRSIDDGVPPVPAPSFYKCKSCDVRELCSFNTYRADKEKPDAPIQSGESSSEDESSA